MRLLLDTHVILWALTNSVSLSDTARRLISDGKSTILYSVIAMWEVAIKHERHPDRMLIDGRDFEGLCEEAGFHQLPLASHHVRALESLRQVEGSPYHADPFDRIMLAQAKADDLVLLTHDARLGAYGEHCVLMV